MHLLCHALLAAGAAAKLNLRAGGASFPAAMYQDVTFAYSFRKPASASADISYHSVGSSAGKRWIKDGTQRCEDDVRPCVTLDWAASDSLLTESDYAAQPDLQMFPTLAGAVVPIFNLPNHTEGEGQDLLLTPTLVSKIFRGAVTRWDHPEIVSINPLLALPAERILLCVRADGSGTTEIFKKALSAFEQEFKEQVGADSGTRWGLANVTRRRLNSGVATYVAHTPYLLGYSVLAEAESAGLPFAALLKGDHRVRASPTSVAYALAELGLEIGNEREVLTADVHNALGLMAWPICGYTYLVMRTDPLPAEVPGSSLETRRAVVNFWRWFYTDEQGVVARLAAKNGFAPLPPSIVSEKVLPFLLKSIRWQGVPVALPEPKPSLTVVGPVWLSSAFEQLGIIYEQDPHSNAETSYAVVKTASRSSSGAAALEQRRGRP